MNAFDDPISTGYYDCYRCWLEGRRMGESLFRPRMFLCPQCGNKRCPRATDHRNACTRSNKPGQPGSIY